MKIIGTIIVPVFNGEDYIDIFFDSFRVLMEAENVETIIVDNGSTDKTVRMLDRFVSEEKSIRLLTYSAKQSSYGARNCGALHAKGDWLIFTDIDCQAGDSYVESVRGIISQKAEFPISGPVNIFLNSGNMFELYDREAYLKQDLYLSKGYAATANLMVPKIVHRAVGGFDVFVSGADNLFCKKCARFGREVQKVDGLEILHPARSTYEEHIKKAKRIGVGLAQFYVGRGGVGDTKIVRLIRSLAGIIMPIHQLKIFLRLRQHQTVSSIGLLKFCYIIGATQRVFLIKSLILGVDDRLGNEP